MTTRANLYIDQGASFRTSLEINTLSGNEYPIGDKEFFCQVRKVYSSNIAFDAIIEAIDNDVVNTIDLIITPDMTNSIDPGKYQYDVIMKETNGQIVKILEGLMFIIQSITKISGA